MSILDGFQWKNYQSVEFLLAAPQIRQIVLNDNNQSNQRINDNNSSHKLKESTTKEKPL